MENKSLLQSFALDKNGRVRAVSEVPRGRACDCACPSCGAPVVARQGDVREWHFAHSSGVECGAGAETALHRAAKQLLLDSQGMTVPEVRIQDTVTLPDGRSGTGEAYRPEAWVDFQAVELEKEVGGIRPDVVVTTGDAPLFVEVAVTHFAEPQKKSVLESLGVPCIEVNLALVERDCWAWEALKHVLIETAHHKQWLFPMGLEVLAREARDAAEAAALKNRLPEPAAVFEFCRTAPAPQRAASPVRTRFWLGRRMVDVRELPFGLAVWCPYDPELNELIKSLTRPLGGRWQPKFKNWLLPVEAKPYLFEELEKRSVRPPEVRT